MTAKLLSITVKVALSLLLATIVGALALVTVVPRAIGGAALTVLTGSMTPEIPVGSVVLVRPVDPAMLQVGDVITYQAKPGVEVYVTHRIREIHTGTSPATLTTKGDANPGDDQDPVPVTAVRGEVVLTVPYLGTVRETIGVGPAGLLLAILGLVGYALAQLVSAMKDKRSTRRASQLAVVEVQALVLMVDDATEMEAASLVASHGVASHVIVREDDDTAVLCITGTRVQLSAFEASLTHTPLHAARTSSVLVPRSRPGTANPRTHIDALPEATRVPA